jgi:hypothetical protein
MQVGLYEALPGGFQLVIPSSKMLNTNELFRVTKRRNVANFGHIDFQGIVIKEFFVQAHPVHILCGELG